MIKYNYNVTIKDNFGHKHNVATVAEMFTEALLKALNKCRLANFDASEIKIECKGVYKNERN